MNCLMNCLLFLDIIGDKREIRGLELAVGFGLDVADDSAEHRAVKEFMSHSFEIVCLLKETVYGNRPVRVSRSPEGTGTRMGGAVLKKKKDAFSTSLIDYRQHAFRTVFSRA